jgi:hypothetical protein
MVFHSSRNEPSLVTAIAHSFIHPSWPISFPLYHFGHPLLVLLFRLKAYTQILALGSVVGKAQNKTDRTHGAIVNTYNQMQHPHVPLKISFLLVARSNSISI